MLERDVFGDHHDALATAVERAGASIRSWSDDWWLEDRWPRLAGEPVVFHGSPANADAIVRRLPWTPGAFCRTERFLCSEWWPRLADVIVAPEHTATSVRQLVEDGPPATYGDRIFVRPDSPLKPFAGRVLAREELTFAALDHGFYYDDMELPVVVAPAGVVGQEWRFVVCDGSVVAGSGYAVASGRIATERVGSEHAAWRYAAALTTRVAPEAVFVMDVCETPRGLRLLELNPFSGADLYDCDRDAVVAALNYLVDTH